MDEDRPKKKRLGTALHKPTGSSSMSPPNVSSSEQTQQLRKRRQQSLDLRVALEHSAGRPALRVQTTTLATKQAAAVEANDQNMSASSSSPPRSSPLSVTAPPFATSFANAKTAVPAANPFMYSHYPTSAVPMAAGAYQHPSTAAAMAAAAFVAHAGVTQQQLQVPPTQTYSSVMNLGNVPMTAAQFNSVMGINIAPNPSVPSNLQVSSMPGFMTQPHQYHHHHSAASLGLIDMASFPAAFAPLPTSSASSPPQLTDADMALIPGTSQFNQH
ncbi:hypothetical protein IWW38_004224 [Coemansia aciculifera]|uniref:Uncharacterized protein n=1 Tax=Coemansia aciculifera TaxID=417176 RepID=A0ACC1LYG1_9FUNG|nr:hypothetical protein IWW38_004224 [Coemansia aciculifera]